MFAAFVHIDNAHGCRAIIEEFGQIKEFEGVTLVTPVAGKIPRLLQRFERCFSTRQEAADWAAGEIGKNGEAWFQFRWRFGISGLRDQESAWQEGEDPKNGEKFCVGEHI